MKYETMRKLLTINRKYSAYTFAKKIALISEEEDELPEWLKENYS
jgi:hypothetical protein